jgi:N-acetylmuramoyl-L-alanine amidase
MRSAPRAGMRWVASGTPIMIAMLVIIGCARRPGGPPIPPPIRPHSVTGYERLADSLGQVDTKGLAGRRIVLDPGHGGSFRGALGVNGLTEAEVNLAVALRLRDLLAAGGAQVLLTRDRDRDFRTPADSSLRADLAERVRLANRFRPDLFLSIHHNADAAGAHDVNETQTYYKLGDEGPSLDVAQDVHRALVRNVGIRPHKVVPGNYFVLRNGEGPALLTETSYITNPEVEQQLRRPEKQELEAQALYIGVARYFARPLPVIDAFAAHDPDVPAEDSLFVSGDPSLSARVRGDFDLAELVVDGRPATIERLGDRLEWRPQAPWTAGEHEARLRVRLSGVGAARERLLRFTVAPGAARLRASLWPEAVGERGGLVAVRVELLGARGVPSLESRSVRIRSLAPRVFATSETVAVARDGVAWAYFRARPWVEHAPRRTPAFRVSIEPTASAAGGRAAPETLRWAQRRTDAPTWSGFVRLMPDGGPLREAPGTREPARLVRWLNRDGFAVLPADSTGTRLVPRLEGYRRWAGDGAPGFVPLAGGVLHGRRVTLDPEGGGDDAAGVGGSGVRAAHLNLEAARILAAMLEAAGAEVHLTRTGDLALSEVERVQGSEDFKADRFLRIGHRVRRFGYYFSSAAGRLWAAGSAAAFDSLGLAAPPPAEDALYPLQQASCPALYASPARVDSSRDEEALLAAGNQRAEAYALFLGLAREWNQAARWAMDSLEVRDSSGAAVSGAHVTLGDALVLETDRTGRIRFARTEAGPIEAVVDDRRVKARAVLLDSTRGAVLAGMRGN